MINNISDKIWGVRTEPCGLRRDEPNWREVCFQVNVSIHRNYDACPSSMIQIYKWICNPKKGLDCGHGIGSQQRRPNDEQTTETPFLSRCHMILMFKTVSGSHYSIFISYLLLQVWAGATWWFFRNRFRIALFVSYLLLQVCPYKIQRSKENLFGSQGLPASVSTLLYPSLCWNDDQHKEPIMIDTRIIYLGN